MFYYWLSSVASAWTRGKLSFNSSLGVLFLYCHSDTPQPASPLIVYLHREMDYYLDYIKLWHDGKINNVSLYLPRHLQNLSTILDSHSSPKNARPLSSTSTWVERGME